ncbi:hypothetical protein BD408DRAFT_425451 [Parasitella parasitica]|nr:hypothetical protein BD408DRAFT_425451 [Parasitella parasitica]
MLLLYNCKCATYTLYQLDLLCACYCDSSSIYKTYGIHHVHHHTVNPIINSVETTSKIMHTRVTV